MSKQYTLSNTPALGQFSQLHKEFDKIPFGDLIKPTKAPKVIFVGDHAVGKTTFCRAIETGEFQANYIVTVGVEYHGIECFVNGLNFLINLWDTAGEEKNHSLTKSYYRACNIAVLCFSLHDPDSFEHVAFWLDSVKNSTSEDLIGIMLLGMKSDLSHKVKDSEIKNFCETHSLEYFETSAKNMQNVEAVMNRIIFLTSAYQISGIPRTQRVVSETVELQSNTNAKKNKGCCN
ncbi:Ras family protein [Histomonas meleagridis]|uniref:Ras family protein n=1 Tax=Histomonas meleagridis TaxID=135588 RepID=UPI00355947DD|nr:Ras family protein [Histomonas meleagridis]KAH0802375.1 Ras family protein [Histomonas meleagridis]